MRARPADVDDRELGAQVSREWKLDLVDIRYVAVGGGSHHWQARDASGRDYWLNVDDLDCKPFLASTPESTFEGLQRALATAVALRDAGLEFVVAPLPSGTGACVSRFGTHYAVSAYPCLTGTSRGFDETLPLAERTELEQLLARLHAATPSVRDLAPPWRLQIALRDELEDALVGPSSRWTGGPLLESARALIAPHTRDVQSALVQFDRLSQAVAETTAAGDLVVTHGEPHPANLLIVGGRLHLIDWDTVALAPPERDLWLVRGFGGKANRAALDLYRLRWQLLDLASFVDTLRARHVDNADTRHALRAIDLTLSTMGRQLGWADG